jgi:hypothetical protein
MLVAMIAILLPAYAYAQARPEGDLRGGGRTPDSETGDGGANAMAMVARIRSLQRTNSAERNKRQTQYVQLAPLPQGDALQGSDACAYKLSNGVTLRTNSALTSSTETSSDCVR